jgi:3,4-dihydroxy-2-butanone 4-phosphate synthase
VIQSASGEVCYAITKTKVPSNYLHLYFMYVNELLKLKYQLNQHHKAFFDVNENDES